MLCWRPTKDLRFPQNVIALLRDVIEGLKSPTTNSWRLRLNNQNIFKLNRYIKSTIPLQQIALYIKSINYISFLNLGINQVATCPNPLTSSKFNISKTVGSVKGKFDVYFSKNGTKELTRFMALGHVRFKSAFYQTVRASSCHYYLI